MLWMLRTDRIETPDWYRLRAPDETDVRRLADSIRAGGVLEPILVVRLSRGRLLLASGDRRLRAARLAGKKRIPARVFRGKETDALRITLCCSMNRGSSDALCEAAQLRLFADSLPGGGEQAAKLLGIEPCAAADRLRLLGIPPAARERLRREGAPPEILREIARLPAPLREEAADGILDREMSPKQAHRFVDGILARDTRGEARRRQIIVKDVRIFQNTITRTVEVMKQAGLDASEELREESEYLVYVVKIPKQQALAPARSHA